MGKDATSAHNYSTQCFENFKDSNVLFSHHKVIEKLSAKTSSDAMLRLKVTIDYITPYLCVYYI